MTDQTEAAEVERVVCPEHGQPLALEGRGPEGSGPFFHAWICPECSNVRRCGSCGKAAPEAWSSGRCHDCYRVQSSRLRREEADRKQADYDAAIAAAEARGNVAAYKYVHGLLGDATHEVIEEHVEAAIAAAEARGAERVLAAVEAAGSTPRFSGGTARWMLTAARAAAIGGDDQ